MQDSFKFAGNGTEYFKIWLVNLMLSILTLGIYTPWAKVRTSRYFYNNLSYQGHYFDYLASPIAILKGRIIAVILLVIYVLTANYMLVLNSILAVVLTVATPAIIYRSIRFNARVSRFRNVRFDFSGKYVGALKAFVLFPILAFISLGVLYPWLKKQQTHYKINFLHYGNINFTTKVTNKQFYAIYTKVSIIIVTCIISTILIVILSSDHPLLFIYLIFDNLRDAGTITMIILSSYFLLVVLLSAFIKAQTSNIIFNATSIDQHHQLSANFQTLGIAKIYFTYGLLMLITFGITYAWLKVAMMHYQAEHTQLILANELDTVLDNIPAYGSATGEQLSEVFDVDVGMF